MKQGKSRKIGDGLDRLGAGVVLVMSFGFLLFLTGVAYWETSSVTMANKTGELVESYRDNIFLNALILVILLSSLYLFYRHRDDISLQKIELVLMSWTLVIGLAFIVSVKLYSPWYSDSFYLTTAAQRAARGDMSGLDTYFIRFPFQLGFVLYEELFFRICLLLIPGLPEGYYCLMLQGVNLLWLMFSYHALIKIAGNLFCSIRIQKMTALLFFFCIPAFMSCTFLYGNIPALGCGVAAMWMFTEFTKRYRLRYGLLCAALMGIAVALKMNLLIFFVALGAVWLIELIKKFSVKSALCFVLMVLAVFAMRRLPQDLYERRSGMSFGEGIPLSGWLAMGMSEGHAAPGWYKEDNTVAIFSRSGNDPEAVKENAKKVIAERTEFFKNNPGEARDFFSVKLRSQWNEPTYGSVWINRTHPSYGVKGGLYRVLCSDENKVAKGMMNQYQQLIFLGTLLALFMMWKERSTKECLLLIAVLGGVLYHLMFEAKSQYALSYFILMVPMAANGLCGLFLRISKR